MSLNICSQQQTSSATAAHARYPTPCKTPQYALQACATPCERPTAALTASQWLLKPTAACKTGGEALRRTGHTHVYVGSGSCGVMSMSGSAINPLWFASMTLLRGMTVDVSFTYRPNPPKAASSQSAPATAAALTASNARRAVAALTASNARQSIAHTRQECNHSQPSCLCVYLSVCCCCSCCAVTMLGTSACQPASFQRNAAATLPPCRDPQLSSPPQARPLCQGWAAP